MRSRNSVNRSLIVLITLSALLIPTVFGCSAPAAPAAPAASQPLYTTPKLGINPATISIQFTEGDSKTVSKNLTIANEGEGVMVWAARKTASWIWMNEPDGAIEKGFTKTLEIFFAPSGLAAGTYTDNISVEGLGTRNSPQYVAVTMLIKPAPVKPKGDDNSVLKQTVPPPPWEYSEYKDDNYNFRLRYPKEYSEKLTSGWALRADASIKQQLDTIMLNISSSYGVDYRAASVELTKSAIRTAGGTPRADPKVIADDNTTMLADGVTHAWEMIYELRTTPTLTYQCYLFGTQKGSRYIVFAACAPLPYANDRIAVWKQIARTLEFLD